MSPAKRHPLYPQAITNLNMLKIHEYCLVFRKSANKETIENINADINWSRPTVSSIYKTQDKLFWSKDKGKIDWINDQMLNDKPVSIIDSLFE